MTRTEAKEIFLSTYIKSAANALADRGWTGDEETIEAFCKKTYINDFWSNMNLTSDEEINEWLESESAKSWKIHEDADKCALDDIDNGLIEMI